MTPCEELGYKVGDRFEANGSVVFYDGTILTLVEDDCTSLPLFEVIDSQHNMKGGKGYCSLENVTKIHETKNHLRPGDYVSTKGMTEEQYHAVAKAFIEAGAENGEYPSWKWANEGYLQGFGWRLEGDLYHGDYIDGDGYWGETEGVRHLTIDQVLGEEEKSQKIRDVFLGDGPLLGLDSLRHASGWTSLCVDEEQPTIQSLLKKADKHARKAQKHEAKRQEAIEQARAMLPEGWELTDTGVKEVDLNDPANWREGDVLEVVDADHNDGVKNGDLVVHNDSPGNSVPYCKKPDGGIQAFVSKRQLRFHHRQ